MSRHRTGCAQWDEDAGVWIAWLTIGEVGHTHREPVAMRDKHTGDLLVPKHEKCACTNKAPCVVREQAQAFATVLAKRAIDRGATPEGAGETVSEWWKRYLEAAERGEVGRRNKGRPQVNVKARRSRFRDYIEPHIGAIPMLDVRAEDIHRVVVALNAMVRERARFYASPTAAPDARKPGLSSKSATNVWAELRSGFRTACKLGNVPGLKLRDTDPTQNVEPPIAGASRDQAALFPSELSALLACEDVPIFRRALYAVAAYLGPRESELRALRKRDVDLEHRMVRVGEQLKTNSGARTRTKTDAGARDIPIHANLLPLVERLVKALDGDDRILRVPPSEDCASKLRADLERAGVTRRELFEDTERMQPFTFHGLRHTCLTHWAIAANGNAWTLAAAGHTDHATASRYIARANLLRVGNFGEPHPPLPTSLIESSGFRDFVNDGGAKTRKSRRFVATPMGIERTKTLAVRVADSSKKLQAPQATPSVAAVRSAATPSVETLRAKLDAAILAEQWAAVATIAARIREIERADVVDLDLERRRRESR